MYIDSHVHARDEDWAHKETIAHALQVAIHSNLSGVFIMPNDPKNGEPVISRKRVLDKIGLIKAARCPVFCGIYVGVTNNPDQIKEAVECVREFSPKRGGNWGVIGLKMYAGESTGDLSVTNFDDQRVVYETLAKLGYEGVLAVHCEKESEMKRELLDLENPISHCYARPLEAEIASIQDQLTLTLDAGYACFGNPGKLHFVHLTSPESIRLVNGGKLGGIGLSCAATFHHLLLNEELMKGENGIFYKVNPPLRSRKDQEGLLECFKENMIDVLESDHAPHTPEEKSKGASGIAWLPWWQRGLEILLARGVTEDLILKTAYSNVKRIFGINIPRLYNRGANARQFDKDYAFNPWESLAG